MTLEVAEALRTRALLRREDIPPIAASLLEQGYDTHTIRRLAGLVGDDLAHAADLFDRVLTELGRLPPSASESAEHLANYLARGVLEPGADPRAIAADGERLAIAFDYADPLMPFYRASDWYATPEIRPRATVDRELVKYARLRLGLTPL